MSRAIDAPPLTDDFRGPWLTSRQAQAFVCSKTLKAFYAWRQRHGIVPRSNGTVLKADLDRALQPPRRRRRMHPNSIANLRQRRAS
jgi:hypothetical protein